MNSDKIIKDKHYVTSPFGMRIHPITRKLTMHYGTDYGTDGLSVATYPFKDGIVTGQGWHFSLGNYVIIKYMINGATYYSRHQHLRIRNCRVGQLVNNNTVIGYVGTTGSSTGIHLHFQWYKDGYGDKFSIDFEKWVEPKPLPAVIKYTVKRGDNLSSIGAKYGMSWQTLYNKNRAVIGSNPNQIKVGQVLIIK